MRTRPLRVICVAGARPNYMKVKPVMDALADLGAEDDAALDVEDGDVRDFAGANG